MFEKWCLEQSTPVVSFQASVRDFLCFLQSRIQLGLSFSTIKVYLAAISPCYEGFEGKTVGQHPLVCRFLKSARCLLLFSRPLFPTWDLTVVLDAL